MYNSCRSSSGHDKPICILFFNLTSLITYSFRMAEGSLAFYDSLGDPGTMQREKVRKQDKLKLYDAPKPYDGIQPTTPTSPKSPAPIDDYDTITRNLTLTKSKREMMSTMREDQFQEFNNDTIKREDSAKRQSRKY